MRYVLFRIHGNDDWMNFDNQQMMEANEKTPKSSEFKKELCIEQGSTSYSNV